MEILDRLKIKAGVQVLDLLKRLKIRTRMLCIVVGSSFALVVLGLVGMVQLGRMHRQFAAEFGTLARVSDSQEVRKEFTGLHMDLQNLSARGPAALEAGLPAWRIRLQGIRSTLDSLAKGDMSASERVGIKVFSDAFDAYAAQAGADAHPDPALLKTFYDSAEAAGLRLKAANLKTAREAYDDNTGIWHQAMGWNVGLLLFFITAGAWRTWPRARATSPSASTAAGATNWP
jgi:hypothetical protein